MVHSFKIDLKGIIDLLSNHLYSDPSVFVRELLQNAVDAITARKNAGDRFDPNIQVTVESEGETRRLVFEDNGIGLTEDEIHEFLATIGRSSKRISEARESYLGQFGIGLLSCFMVSKEIRVYTQSSKGGPAACWIAQPDGTYEISQTHEAPEVGTRVILEAREDFDYLFDFENLQEDLFGYGEILPYPIHLSSGEEYAHVNAEAVPWVTYAETGDAAQKEQVLAYARERLGLEALDCFPLKTQAGGVSGVAFVLPYSTQSNSRQWHRVYLKNMLLSSQIDNLLPEWAFFVRCFLNVQGLHPTASRESFYEDELLTQARTELNQQMQAWIRHLTQHDQEGLRRLLQLHYLPMRALAVDNDEFYKLLVHSFSFETSTGHMTLGDYLKSNSVIRYVTNLDQFRQISQVASAYGHSVINAVYTYDIPILRKYTSMFGVPTEEIDATTYAHTLEDVQSEGLKEFLLLAQDALSSLECQVTVKKFIPDTLPALFIVSEVHQELSDIEQAQEVSDDLWSDVLEDYASELRSMRVAHLHLNFNNSLVQSMMHAENPKVVRRLVQMLYVQAHLLGHHPMRQEELGLLTEGLQEMMYWGLRADRMLN